MYQNPEEVIWVLPTILKLIKRISFNYLQKSTIYKTLESIIQTNFLVCVFYIKQCFNKTNEMIILTHKCFRIKHLDEFIPYEPVYAVDTFILSDLHISSRFDITLKVFIIIFLFFFIPVTCHPNSPASLTGQLVVLEQDTVLVNWTVRHDQLALGLEIVYSPVYSTVQV